METTAFHERFNATADEFFKDLVNGFPNSPEYASVIGEFRTLRSGLSLLKNVDVRKPQQMFKTYILDNYRDMIVLQDSRFFMERQDFGIQSQRMEYWEDFIAKIKKAWVNMDKQNQVVIWKYFKVLMILSDKCSAETSRAHTRPETAPHRNTGS